MATSKEVEQLRTAYIRGAETMITAPTGDVNLPSGVRLAKRPQLQVDCTPVDKAAGKCRLRHGWGYGAAVIDRVCQPLCAMAVLAADDGDGS
ncbi:MAG TPA: hypothetical protein DGG94_22315 [Micromonosporaceae bacterium]|nr:hypothetical protein [Micromonosporaceae bacterium]HCU52493.1 hypothetical protein [Micromonosporaceae bacterium]